MKEYTELQQKYSLPSFEELDNEFEISSIEETNFLLREIRRKMTDKLDYFAKILEQLLHPDTSLSAMVECKYIDNDKAYSIFKQLMVINRRSLMIYLNENDEHDAQFIKETFEKWKILKIGLNEVLEAINSSWEQEQKQDKIGYFG